VGFCACSTWVGLGAGHGRRGGGGGGCGPPKPALLCDFGNHCAIEATCVWVREGMQQRQCCVVASTRV
jgi:hypothetical protein